MLISMFYVSATAVSTATQTENMMAGVSQKSLRELEECFMLISMFLCVGDGGFHRHTSGFNGFVIVWREPTARSWETVNSCMVCRSCRSSISSMPSMLKHRAACGFGCFVFGWRMPRRAGVKNGEQSHVLQKGRGWTSPGCHGVFKNNEKVRTNASRSLCTFVHLLPPTSPGTQPPGCAPSLSLSLSLSLS